MARSGNTYNMQSSLVDCSCFFNSYMRSTFKDDFSGRFCAHQWGYTFDSDQRLFPLATLGVISLNILGGVETSMQTLFHIIFVFQPVKKNRIRRHLLRPASRLWSCAIYGYVCKFLLGVDCWQENFWCCNKRWAADRAVPSVYFLVQREPNLVSSVESCFVCFRGSIFHPFTSM